MKWGATLLYRRGSTLKLQVPQSAFSFLGGQDEVSVKLVPDIQHRSCMMPNERKDRDRKIWELIQGKYDRDEIAHKVGVSSARISDIRKFGVRPTLTYLARNMLTEVFKVFGLGHLDAWKGAWSESALICLKEKIEADPIWRLNVLQHHSKAYVRHIEWVCQEEGILIEPATTEKTCAGLTARSYNKFKELMGMAPEAHNIISLMEARPERLEKVYAQDSRFRDEMEAFYEYKTKGKRL